MKPVRQIDPETGEVVARFPSQQAAAESIYGATSSTISKACNGKVKTAYGYRWEYDRKPQKATQGNGGTRNA